MDIGTGIAIAGVWLFAAAVVLSPSTTNVAFWIAIIVALMTTASLSGHVGKPP